MESTNLELKLNFKLSKKMKSKTYAMVTLFHGTNSKFEKRIVNMDINGNAKLNFEGVNVESACLRTQVFIQRKYFPDKNAVKVDVWVSDLIVSSWSDDHKGPATYEFGTSSCKPKEGLLKMSAQVPITCKKQEVEIKRVGDAIGNDIGLFKTIPTFRTPLVSVNWT